MFSAVMSTSASPAELDRPTLLRVVSAIERRIADLDRRGPPNAPGHCCNSCKDAELHRLLGVLRELASGRAR
jgi:hypothetical protein